MKTQTRKERRKLAGDLLQKVERFADYNVFNKRVVRCHETYWVISFDVNMSDWIVFVELAYNYRGICIGDSTVARMLAKRGIVPEARRGDVVCSFGRSMTDGKWYGWNHRAIHGFKKGDKVKKGDVTNEYLPVGFTAVDEASKRKMALAFARSVS